MKNYKNIKTFVTQKKVFCGMDVHYKHWSLCFVCDGEVVEKLRIQADYLALKFVLVRYKAAREIQIVYEAGFSGFWLYRKLKYDGYSCIVTPPSLTPKTVGKVKTDKRDAEKLAFYLSAGLLKSVYVPPENVESDRRTLRGRVQVVKKRTRAKHQIRSYLNLMGFKRPESIKTNWSQQYIAWLKNIEFKNDSDKFNFSQLIKDYLRLDEDVAEVTGYILKMSRSDKYQKNFKLLTCVQGIGLITGMTFLLEIYDFDRFKTGEHFASYLGLTPSQYSSGEHIRLGHITRQGNTCIRKVLVEAAWTVIRYDPHLRDKYNRIRSRGTNGKKAIVAVARSLAIRLRRGLLDGTGYVVGVC